MAPDAGFRIVARNHGLRKLDPRDIGFGRDRWIHGHGGQRQWWVVDRWLVDRWLVDRWLVDRWLGHGGQGDRWLDRWLVDRWLGHGGQREWRDRGWRNRGWQSWQRR